MNGCLLWIVGGEKTSPSFTTGECRFRKSRVAAGRTARCVTIARREWGEWREITCRQGSVTTFSKPVA